MSGTARPFEPEGDAPRATGCHYGNGEPGVYVTVFATSSGGTKMVAEQQRVLAAQHVEWQDLSGASYRAHKTQGPRDGSESLVVLRGDRYANVVLFNARPGAIDRLAADVATSL